MPPGMMRLLFVGPRRHGLRLLSLELRLLLPWPSPMPLPSRSRRLLPAVVGAAGVPIGLPRLPRLGSALT
eukprot:4679428-Alexandrium_andersonii.AAC.1